MGWLGLIGAMVFGGALIYGFATGNMRTIDPLSVGGRRDTQPKLFWFAAAINSIWTGLCLMTFWALVL